MAARFSVDEVLEQILDDDGDWSNLEDDSDESEGKEEAMADNERHQELNETKEDYEGRSNLWNFYHRWMAPTEEPSEAELMEVEIPQDSHVNNDLEAMTENERTVEEDNAEPMEVDEPMEENLPPQQGGGRFISYLFLISYLRAIK